MIKSEKGIPRQREPYKHSNRGITDGPQYYNNLKLQQYKEPLLNAWPTQWFDSPLYEKQRPKINLRQIEPLILNLEEQNSNVELIAYANLKKLAVRRQAQYSHIR